MILYFLPVLAFVFLNGLFVHIFKRHFGVTIPFTMVIVFLILYFTQFLFKTFNVGLILLWGGAVAGLTLVIIRRKQASLFFSPGLIAFLCICLFVFIWDYHRNLKSFDEFWFWGITIKESLRLDRFYCIDLSNVPIHKDYPPFQMLIELFWCRTAGFYNEDIASMGLHIFTFSFFAPPMAELILKKKDNERNNKEKVFESIFVGVILILTSIVVVIFLDNKNVMPTLLTDIPQAFALAFVLYWILSEQAFEGIFGFLNTLALCIAFPMIKQVGLAFLAFAIALFAFQGVLKKVSAKKILLQILGLTTIPLGVFGVWKLYIKRLGVTDMRAIEGGTGQFDFAKVNLSDLALVLLHKKPGIMQDTLNNYYKALFERNISSSTLLCMTFITSFMLLLLLIFVFSKRYASIATKTQVKSMYFECIVSIIGFAIGQGILFLFCFTPDEMIELRGFERYMDSFFIGELLAILMLYICYETKLITCGKSVYKRLLILLAVLCIFFSQNNLVRLLPQALGDDPNVFYKTQGDTINENTETGSNITAVYDKSLFTGWYGGYQSYVSYYANDKKLLWGTDLYSLDYEKDEEKELAVDQILQSDYLYFINVTDNMREFYDSMIEDGYLCDNTFYRVVVIDDSIVLLAVN